MREPWFWREKTLAAKTVSYALAPLGALYNAGQKIKWRMTSQTPAPLPVICIGNASLGGVGKTPFAILLSNLLSQHNVKTAFLTRGYGGQIISPALIDLNQHTAIDVGDEALLLAKQASCWIARDRPAGALLARKAGAEALIMDDGFQNFSLKQTLSLLLIASSCQGASKHVFPAGPMREPLKQALHRADAVIEIRPTPEAPAQKTIEETLPALPLFTAWLEPQSSGLPERVIAFCGIARPQRFFNMLKHCKVEIAARISFPDHHPYAAAELKRLRGLAKKEKAVLLTTEKDYVRLPNNEREGVQFLPVSMVIDNPDALTELALKAIDGWWKNDGTARGVS